VRIELLYFENCPSWEQTRANVHASLAELALPGKIDLLLVKSNAEARKHRFLGSPTLRINGQDLFPIEGDQFALGCRVFATPRGLVGIPTSEMVKSELIRLIS